MFGKLKTRALSALIFVPLMLLGALLGGWVFLVLLLAVSIIGGFEFRSILQKMEYRFSLFLFIPSAVLLLVANAYGQDVPALTLGLYFIIFVLHAVFFIFGHMRIEEMAMTFFALFYIAFTLSTLAMVRFNFADGFWIICMIFLIQWLTDTGAYFIGSAFGRHKLMPSVSPKKSVEGAIGGIAAAILVVFLFNLIADVMPMGPALVMAFFASILGQIGDLFESAIKRWADVKDAGTLIPGHGGVLDRFDSLLFIAPFCYYFLSIVTHFLK